MGVQSLELVVETAAGIAADITAGESDTVDRDGTWPEDTMQAARDSGLAGLVVPAEHGGLGHGLIGLERTCEILGRESGSAGLCFGMHCVGTAVIASKATPEQARRYLEPIARGQHITTLALSEPGTGSHFYFPQTGMSRNGNGYVVRGEKSFVTNGGYADSYVVSTVAADPSAAPGHFSCVMIPAKAEGVIWGPPWRGFGMRGNSSRNCELRDVEIGEGDLLGAEGDQIWFVFNVVAPYFLVAMAGTYVGIARRALDEAVAHLQRRTHSHSGVALAEIDVLQHRLGEVWAKYLRTRQLARWAAEEGDRGGEEALAAIIAAKAEVAPCVVEVVNDCMTLVGGMAYRDSSVFPRLLRDARAADVMAPTTDILYTWLGRSLLDLPLLGD